MVHVFIFTNKILQRLVAGRGSFLEADWQRSRERKVEGCVLAPSPQPSDEVKDSAGLILLMKAHLSSKMIFQVLILFPEYYKWLNKDQILVRTNGSDNTVLKQF